MNVCGYCGKENHATAAICRECGTDLLPSRPGTLATAATRWTFGQMLVMAATAFFIAVFIPSGLVLLLADSSRFASLQSPHYAAEQKLAACIFIALGLTAGLVGYWLATRLRRQPVEPSKQRTSLFLCAGLLFPIATGFGLVGALFLAYCFSGVP